MKSIALFCDRLAIALLAPAGFAMAQVSGPTKLGITEVELKDVTNGVSTKRHVNPVGGDRLLQLAASGTAVIAQMSVDVTTSLPTLRQAAHHPPVERIEYDYVLRRGAIDQLAAVQ